VTIYYTLDGSEPDPENLEGSTYRYKNSYQQPPKEIGERVEIKNNFLYNEYKTYRYQQPIPITDRTYEPDRISQISTTFDEEPDYFPKTRLLNLPVNKRIKKINNYLGRLNEGIDNYIKTLTIRKALFGVGITNDKKEILDLYMPMIEYSSEFSPKGTPVR